MASSTPRQARHGEHEPWGQFGTFTIACLLLFMGATGKSAQLPLYVWLPDAMEGPTPVSALIHAATMVTAGVYVVARSHVLFVHSETAMVVVAVIGCATAFFAATIGLVQTDIKRVLAYSTVSQLGYMFLACGVGAFSAGIFHLMTHAFFKALLFLAAGSVIHAMGGEQDMRQMGGLSKKIKYTYWTMLIATLAIAGIPPLAGFFSKDAILLSAFQIEGGHPLYAIGLLTALLTSFYMFRLIFLTFAASRAMTSITSMSTNRPGACSARWSFSRCSPSSADGSLRPRCGAAPTISQAFSPLFLARQPQEPKPERSGRAPTRNHSRNRCRRVYAHRPRRSLLALPSPAGKAGATRQVHEARLQHAA